MSSIVRVALAAAISLAFASNAIAQKRILAVTREQEVYDFTTRHGATQIRAARQLQEP